MGEHHELPTLTMNILFGMPVVERNLVQDWIIIVGLDHVTELQVLPDGRIIVDRLRPLDTFVFTPPVRFPIERVSQYLTVSPQKVEGL